jgi:hypothetical protein
MKTKKTIWRAIFNPCNSCCGSEAVKNLSHFWWWTDNSFESLHIHACRWEDRTYHRVYPRNIHGYTCRRIGMKNRLSGERLFWIYDEN